MLDLARIGGLLGECKPGHTLPQALYNSPDIHEFDRKAVFGSTWLLAAFSCEIPAARNYLALTLAGSPIVLTRGTDGVLRGFHNACRHRGAQVCADGPGRRARLTCPYHQWVYDLDGTLVHARNMQPGFDAASHGLNPIHLREVAGVVFVCLAAEAPAFARFEAELAPMLAPHDLENAKVAHTSTLVEKGNWKLVMENARECYHCATGHPELCLTFPIEDLGETMASAGNAHYGAFAAKMGDYGLGLGPYFGPWWQIERFPLKEGSQSLTIDGALAVAKLMVDTPADIGSLRWAIEPHVFCHSTADQTVMFSAMPTGPNETVVTCKWLVHKDAVEGVDYDVDRLIHLWTVTNLQDRDLVEMNQRGVNSIGYTPGPYNERDEAYVKRFTEWYLDTACRYVAARAGFEPLPERMVRNDLDQLVPLALRDAANDAYSTYSGAGHL
ncbi:aromatic ring-hydroxylating dioxygenase subunit alpha [Acuticoccus sp. I52.16.1]|uniref:aromatic ring-hydroxylating oxygenase subunit alpha n=1 Tax=Acuticoccus sp. I52.16.1 TaxID=2928472 RepID=UPI001FD202BD|nr:aromatic ring-hydroxylating dioxygenase subunit alpha [Acuticoccus sp. I52.16.1]UOM35250.1 aromatic ring-hydroxylating dioxygenase subunit alpha [Acuticoccus sp. I52.16.1]